MTARFSLFSHIEDLETGQLVLTDPFRNNADRPSVCRYQLHQQSSEVLNPDTAWQGAASFHQLLPLDQEETRQLNHFPIFKGIEKDSFFIAGSHWQVSRATVNPLLPLIITVIQAKKNGKNKVICPLLGFEDRDFLNGPQACEFQFLLPETWRELFPNDARIEFFQSNNSQQTPPSPWVNIGPWHHPFRLEGMKLVGLELVQQFQEPLTIILHDPSGEWAFALLEAAQLMSFFNPHHYPFRVVLVQMAPYDHLCQLFEGRPYDDSPLGHAPLPAYLPTPEAAGSHLIQTLMTMGGTALALTHSQLQDPSTSLLKLALETLVRTGFVDGEDQVIFLDPHSLVHPNHHHCGD